MSLFHAGELYFQELVGQRERVGRFAQRALRSVLIDEHREFFALLPWLIVGARNLTGHPVASVLSGPPGFVHAPDDRLLRIEFHRPIDTSLAKVLTTGNDVGLLGLLPHVRRRNRANGMVVEHGADHIAVRIDQSFGNCPAHITQRELIYGAATNALPTAPPEIFSYLTPELRTTIEEADTLFIASGCGTIQAGNGQGLDISHRGGAPGFVRVESQQTLIVPDYSGNQLYNTLGNLRLDSRAGLVFVNFENGDLLQLRVRSTIHEEPTFRSHDPRAQRWLELSVEQVTLQRGVLGLRSSRDNPSSTEAT